ncbi:restriction endonuclease [Arcobacter lanthieri]|uniref:restriction endonuclease n=1 Tax=Aliarcobacter lanthieri TaxID=1355374 RepID=UPI0019238550|nr:restriction endonuclease [Aliarcobacter lanthieri]MBL3520052.1 restriction endonuclease [Aliarcobacter lanthieri]
MNNIKESLIQGFYQIWYLPIIVIFLIILLTKFTKNKKSIKHNREIILKETSLMQEFKIEQLNKENKSLKQRVLELEEYENKIRKLAFEENRRERYKKYLKKSESKGKEFEEFVAKYFEKHGYIIELNGIKKGVKDKGIDLICIKDNEMILIQCKNWKENSKYKINHEKLKAFVGCCTEYINEHNLFNKNIKLKFITSNYILDESGKKFLEDSKTLEYKILKF